MPYFASFHINAQNNNPICMNKFTIDIDETSNIIIVRYACTYCTMFTTRILQKTSYKTVFLILWEKLSISGAEIENVKAYLYTTARNAAWTI